MHGPTGHITGAVELRQQVGDSQRVAVQFGCAAVGRCGGLHAKQGWWGAICPPVMPYMALLINIMAMFSPRFAAWIVSGSTDCGKVAVAPDR